MSYIGGVRGNSKLLKTSTDEIAGIARMGRLYAKFMPKIALRILPTRHSVKTGFGPLRLKKNEPKVL